jgi:prevent-host-death family protein
MWPHDATLRDMQTIGIRDLKNRLSEVVRDVRAGGHVLVTDRGTVVAELVPPGRTYADPGVPPGLARLVAGGTAGRGGPHDPALYRPLPPLKRQTTSVAKLLDEARGAR